MSRNKTNKRPKLLDQVRLIMRSNGYSIKTECSYVNWIKRYIIFHKKRHPLYMNEFEISEFINYLSLEKNLSYSSQRQALAAILLLYREVLNIEIGVIENVMRGKYNINKKVTSLSKIETKSKKEALKVFLCHANEDKEIVRDLYSRLIQTGVKPWFDEENLLPGQEWQLEIENSVRSSDVVIVCLSQKSITKTGFVQKEIKFALDIADEQPEGTIFIIPLKIEECVLPFRLKKWQYVDYFKKHGYLRLIQALAFRANTL